MIDTPSDSAIEKIIIAKAVVTDKEQPQITRRKEKSAFSLKMPKKEKRSKRSSAS